MMELIKEYKETEEEIKPGDFFKNLYESSFPKIARYIKNSGGSFEDAKDIFQDAIIIYYVKRQENNFHIRISEEAYVFGISKHL